MGRPLVILAVLGWLVDAAGLAQARGGHGGHRRHGGGRIMGSMGLGSTAACGSPYREAWSVCRGPCVQVTQGDRPLPGV
jgi:hypothetical protein